MTRPRIIIIIALLVVLLIAAGLVYRFVLSPTTSPTFTDDDAGSLPVPTIEDYDSYVPSNINIPLTDRPPHPVPSGATFTVQTPQGSVVVKNFYNTHPVTPDGGGVYLHEGEDYNLFYSIDLGTFSLLLKQQPIDTLRTTAEQAVLLMLGIGQADACKLDVHLNVQNGVDTRTDGGTDYGLSFCPGSRSF